jgi:hypothetical protein
MSNFVSARFGYIRTTSTPHPNGSTATGISFEGGIEQGISGEEPGSTAPYVTTAHLVFDSVQTFQTSFGLHAQEMMEDIPKYTNSEPLVQIGEVKL